MSAATKQALFTSLRTFNQNTVKLPNGDIVDVSNKKGSESYLKAMIQENQGPFSTSLLKAMQFFVDNELDNLDKRTERQLTKSYRLFARDPTAWVESELRKGTITMANIIQNSSDDIVEQAFTKEEMELIFEFMIGLVDEAISRTNAGVVVKEDILISVITVVLKLSNKCSDTSETYNFLSSIAKTVELSTPIVPAEDSGVAYVLARSIITPFNNNLHNGGDREKSVEAVVESGLIQQLLRCISIPWFPPKFQESMQGDLKYIQEFFKHLSISKQLLRERFAKDTPCGDVLEDIVLGRVNPCPENSSYLSPLKVIYDVANKKISEEGDSSDDDDEVIVFECSNCRNLFPEEEMKLCARCKDIACKLQSILLLTSFTMWMHTHIQIFA